MLGLRSLNVGKRKKERRWRGTNGGKEGERERGKAERQEGVSAGALNN